ATWNGRSDSGWERSCAVWAERSVRRAMGTVEPEIKASTTVERSIVTRVCRNGHRRLRLERSTVTLVRGNSRGGSTPNGRMQWWLNGQACPADAGTLVVSVTRCRNGRVAHPGTVKRARRLTPSEIPALGLNQL